MAEALNRKSEKSKNPYIIEGKFVERYREMFGPNTTYESKPTVYTHSNGFLYLDGKPIRKVR